MNCALMVCFLSNKLKETYALAFHMDTLPQFLLSQLKHDLYTSEKRAAYSCQND